MMTQEEIKKYADELAQQYFSDESNIWARGNLEAMYVSEACMRMAKYVEQELIEKACEWLSTEIYSYTWVSYDQYESGVMIDKFLNDFRKAMEE